MRTRIYRTVWGLLLTNSFLFPSCLSHNGGANYIAEPEDYLSITDTVSVIPSQCTLLSIQPHNMFIIDNYLVVANESKDFAFNVFPLPLTGEGFTAVHFGKGPGELIDPDYLSIAVDENRFMIADKDDYYKSFSISDNGISPIGQTRLYNKDIQNGIFKLGSKILNNNDDRVNHYYEYVVLNPDGSKDYLGEVPEWDKEITMEMNSFYYWNYRVVHPDGKRFAEFFWRFRKVRILDDRGHALSETSINYPTPSGRVPDSEGIYSAYGGIPCASKTRIVQFAENTFLRKTNGDISPRTLSEYQVWDWEGHLLKRFIIKEHLELFTVDFKSGIFYGIDPNRENIVFTANIRNLLE